MSFLLFAFQGVAHAHGAPVAVSQVTELPTLTVTPIIEPATPTASPTDSPTPTRQILGVTHEIVNGDTLCNIAELYYGDCRAWPTILEANPELPSRNHLEVGEPLFVPRPESGVPDPRVTPDTKIPIRASSYTLEDIGLSDAENINCDDDCSHLALVRFDPRMYGNVVACPVEWIGTQNTSKLTIEGLGVFYCLDTGAAIKLTYRKVSGYNNGLPLNVYEVDFACPSYPDFHGKLFYEWSREWVPTQQAIEAARRGEGVC